MIAKLPLLFLFSLVVQFLPCVRQANGQDVVDEPRTENSELPTVSTAKIAERFLAANRVVFLGDSNTHAGEFIVQIEAALLDEHGHAPEMINLGLSSETCSGLSEPIHPFPRPNVIERLDRALNQTKPDIVVVCYGMNDGIYHPFDKNRFSAFQAGTNEIIKQVISSGAKLILLTPPPFDALPGAANGSLVAKHAPDFSWKSIYENYDHDVIGRYADWVMKQRDQVWLVVDMHTPLTKHLANVRLSQPKYTFSNDGVHLDLAGHQVFARTFLQTTGVAQRLSQNKQLLELVRQRQSISHPAWISAVGHLRPGVEPGLTLPEAAAKIAPLAKEIEAELSTARR